ncbi:MAG: A/G-specific adenine glycosylase, partial [Actinomycetota bacterium]|nr:A/G-specific adenine glycosylase [Actinomycetota bacterium]
MSVPRSQPHLADRLLTWFDASARDLPWRGGTSPWGVLVSEVMLAQTPVARVIPVWTQWLRRWPEPANLAAEPVAEAIRAWGRLGYPRRALRLHAAAAMITADHGGRVPSDYDALRALPGFGDYTAAAVVSFAFGGRAVVLDVNVRRFLARYVDGIAAPPAHVTAVERARAEALMPTDSPASWAAATME